MVGGGCFSHHYCCWLELVVVGLECVGVISYIPNVGNLRVS